MKLARRSGKPAFFLVNRGRSKAINDECALALTSAYGLWNWLMGRAQEKAA